MSNLKNTIDDILIKLEALNKTVQNNYDLSINHCRENTSTLKTLIHDEIEQLKKMIHNIQLSDAGKKEGISEGDMQLLKDLAKKVSDLEKGFKLISGSINIDAIMKEINGLKELLAKKANIEDVEDLLNKHSI
jgi:hypothetical protein